MCSADSVRAERQRLDNVRDEVHARALQEGKHEPVRTRYDTRGLQGIMEYEDSTDDENDDYVHWQSV